MKEIISIYSVNFPPQHNIKYNDYNDFLNTGLKVFTDGGFKAKHKLLGSGLCNHKGKELLSSVVKSRYFILPTDKSTYWSTDSKKFQIFKKSCFIRKFLTISLVYSY